MKAIISGASKGIGRAISLMLNQLNYELILIARDKAGLDSLINEFQNETPSNILLAIDLSKEESFLEIQNLLSKAPNIHLLINNLGSYFEDSPSKIDLNQLNQLLLNNLNSAIALSQICIPFFERNNQGHIINIGSVLSHQPSIEASSYSISKYALKAWTDGLRMELKPKGIKVSAIYPGPTNSASWDQNHPLIPKLMKPEAVAEAAKAMISIDDSALMEEVYLSPMNL